MLNLKRYLRYLQSYSGRQRRQNAARWLDKFCHANWKVVELECGSGQLASKISGAHYIGIDPSRTAIAQARRRLDRGNVELIEADPRQIEIPEADLVIFLGLLEKMSLVDFGRLLGRIQAKRILFSFTEPPRENFFGWRDRLLFRGLHHRVVHDTDLISEILEQYGYRKREIRRSQWYGPGKMVLAERSLRRIRTVTSPSLAQSAP
jgi:SAM-dependent methyltransferase